MKTTKKITSSETSKIKKYQYSKLRKSYFTQLFPTSSLTKTLPFPTLKEITTDWIKHYTKNKPECTLPFWSIAKKDSENTLSNQIELLPKYSLQEIALDNQLEKSKKFMLVNQIDISKMVNTLLAMRVDNTLGLGRE